jgi:hypothetical protein
VEKPLHRLGPQGFKPLHPTNNFPAPVPHAKCLKIQLRIKGRRFPNQSDTLQVVLTFLRGGKIVETAPASHGTIGVRTFPHRSSDLLHHRPCQACSSGARLVKAVSICFGAMKGNRTVSARFIANTIPDPNRRALTEQAIERGIGNRVGEYQVWIDAPADSSAFHITIEAPEGCWVDRLFDQTDRDVGYIKNFVERAIPRSIPSRMIVLCDTCVRAAKLESRMSAATLSIGVQQEPGYACPLHRRMHHQVVGYVSDDGSQQSFRRVCGGCQVSMYIEFAESPHKVRFRCPSCHAFTTDVLQ